MFSPKKKKSPPFPLMVHFEKNFPPMVFFLFFSRWKQTAKYRENDGWVCTVLSAANKVMRAAWVAGQAKRKFIAITRGCIHRITGLYIKALYTEMSGMMVTLRLRSSLPETPKLLMGFLFFLFDITHASRPFHSIHPALTHPLYLPSVWIIDSRDSVGSVFWHLGSFANSSGLKGMFLLDQTFSLILASSFLT
jgi:hypothetical protein